MIPQLPMTCRCRVTQALYDSASSDAFTAGIPDSAGIRGPSIRQGSNPSGGRGRSGLEATAQSMGDGLLASYSLEARELSTRVSFRTDARLSAVGRSTDRAWVATVGA